MTPAAITATADAAQEVMALDVEYQAVVERSDAEAMARILADDFVLVIGNGRRFDKAELLKEARSRSTVYEVQQASQRSARAWGNTVVVTALLHSRGQSDGKPFDYKLWYSDTYVRFDDGWRYVYGQASSPLPAAR